MGIEVKAIYRDGAFWPIGPIGADFGENAKVVLTVRKPTNHQALEKLYGVLTPEEAEEWQRLVREGRRVEKDQ